MAQPEESTFHGDIVIGTAGHVDHGKTTLVLALTGIDTDRLAEEKARSLTIDLGFAWLDLPDGRRAGIVDVPGHERFIKNMLAGIGGIDLALLVIAADEGPMPQTREHLTIIDLLGIERGVVALTKADLAGEELTGYVAEEVTELLQGTTLQGAPIVPVSSVTGSGLPELRTALAVVAEDVQRRRRFGPPRLPVDRVFTAPGFGAVVTGTMLGGELRIGDQVSVMPAGRPARVRSIQSHNVPLERAGPGKRAAFNLAGVSADAISRGDVIATPGSLTASHRLDVHLHLVDSAPDALEQNDRVDFFSGASQTAAQVSLLEGETIEPGQKGMVQLRLSHPMALLRGDRFIIRRPSPSETIGGGTVLDAQPPRHKRFDRDVLDRLQGMLRGNPEDLVMISIGDAMLERGQVVDEVARTFGADVADATIDDLLRRNAIVQLPSGPQDRDGLLVAKDVLDTRIGMLTSALERHHEAFPLRPGLSREEGRKQTGLSAQAFDALLSYAGQAGVIELQGAVLRLPGFQIRLEGETKAAADAFVAAVEDAPLAPPPPLPFGVDAEILAALDKLGRVVRVSDAIAFAPDVYDGLVRATLAYLETHDEITLAEFRDLVGTTRKYAQPLLEDFDRRKITRRVGDARRKHGGESSWVQKPGQ